MCEGHFITEGSTKSSPLLSLDNVTLLSCLHCRWWHHRHMITRLVLHHMVQSDRYRSKSVPHKAMKAERLMCGRQHGRMFLKQGHKQVDSTLEYIWKVLFWIIAFSGLKFPIIPEPLPVCSHHGKTGKKRERGWVTGWWVQLDPPLVGLMNEKLVALRHSRLLQGATAGHQWDRVCPSHDASISAQKCKHLANI